MHPVPRDYGCRYQRGLKLSTRWKPSLFCISRTTILTEMNDTEQAFCCAPTKRHRHRSNFFEKFSLSPRYSMRHASAMKIRRRIRFGYCRAIPKLARFPRLLLSLSRCGERVGAREPSCPVHASCELQFRFGLVDLVARDTLTRPRERCPECACARQL